MYRPPGRSTHHPGDGCTGEPRPLSPDEGYEIREATHTILTAATGEWHEVVSTGDAVALHYGQSGEWLLSSMLAEHVVRGAKPAQRGPGTVPQLSLTVPEADPEARELLRQLALRSEQSTAAGALAGALIEARAPLQKFVLHIHGTAHETARRVWNGVYHHEDTTPHLTALAFTSQLIIWSARCAPAKAAQPRQRAHLE